MSVCLCYRQQNMTDEDFHCLETSHCAPISVPLSRKETATTAVSVMCFCRKEQPGWVVVNIQKHQQSLLSSKGMGIFIHTWTKLLPESNKMRLVQLKAIWSLYRLSLFTAAERRPCKLQHATSNHIRSQHHPPNRYEKEREREREREPFCRSL